MLNTPSLDQFPLHERELLSSPHAGYVSALSHIKHGFQLRKLKHPYSTANGARRHTHCLHDGFRGFRQISEATLERVSETLGVDVSNLDQSEPLELEKKMLVLVLSPGEKDEAKAAGAQWMPLFRHWGCMPMDEAKFEKWLPTPRVYVSSKDDLMKLTVPREDAERAKAAGAFWVNEPLYKGWYGLHGFRYKLIEWAY